MSDLRFGNAPENGVSARLTRGHPAPTPVRVQVWVRGRLSRTCRFASEDEANRFAFNLTKELANARRPKGEAMPTLQVLDNPSPFDLIHVVNALAAPKAQSLSSYQIRITRLTE